MSTDIEFSDCIVRFDEWVKGDEQSPYLTALECSILLAELYCLGLQLPGPDAKVLSESRYLDAPDVDLTAIRACATRLPIQYYWQVFDGLDLNSTEEPVVGDVADDIVDVYRDVVSVNQLYISGHQDAALWHWNSSMQSHWGRHATGAIDALQQYLSKEVVARASKDLK